MIKKVKISDIKYEINGYPREGINSTVVSEYKEAMEQGAKFPSIVVFDDGKTLHLADGVHRLSVARELRQERISATVRKGSQKDALIYAVGANFKHGHRRTGTDKRKAIELVLRDETLRNRSINSIAKMCRVSWATVRSVWNEKKDAFNLPDFNAPEPENSESSSVQNSGTTLTQSTLSIEALSEAYRYTDRARSWLEQDLKNTSLNEEVVTRMLTDLAHMQQTIHIMTGAATNAVDRIEKMRVPLNIYHFERKGGITENNEFKKKGLCTHSVAVGLGCGNQCTYCSTAVMLRTHPFFQEIHQTSFTRGKAIVDPESHIRLKENIQEKRWNEKLTDEHTILFSNIDDGWSPEAQQHDLGKKILQVLLEETKANVRILTKGAAVSDSFDLIEDYKDRVIVGLSTGIPKSKEVFAEAIEPNAATVSNRLKVLKEAHTRGLRTYGMLCPCLPGIADTKTALREMFGNVLRYGAEDIWLEPVNPRGRAMQHTADALMRIGKAREAKMMLNIVSSDKWSEYTLRLCKNAIEVAEEKNVLDKLHILLYPAHLCREEEEQLREYEQGIIWL